MSNCGRGDMVQENRLFCTTYRGSWSNGKRKMVLLVKNDDGNLQEVKICGLSRAAATDDAATICELLENVAEDPEFLRTVLKCKDACFGYTAFHWAAKYGSTEALEALLKYSAEFGSVHLSLNEGKPTVYSYSIEHKATTVSSLFTNDSPLHVACQNSKLDCVKLLVQHGMNPNQTNSLNQTPLHFACERLDLQTIEYLVEGCKLNATHINQRDSSCNSCDTPLFKVIRSKVKQGQSIKRQGEDKVACIQFLLNHGADALTKGCYGATVIQRATLTRQYDVLKAILDHLREKYSPSETWDILNHRNFTGINQNYIPSKPSKSMSEKPLDLALDDSLSSRKCVRTVQLLLSRGAKPSLKNFDQICRYNFLHYGIELNNIPAMSMKVEINSFTGKTMI